MLKKTKDKVVDISTIWDKNLVKPKENENCFSIDNKSNPILKNLINIAYTENITEISFCLYRVSQRQLKIFEKMQSRGLLPKNINIVLSDTIPAMVKGTYNYLNSNSNFKVNYINTHAKYCVVKTKQNNNYFIVSSGNSNADGKIEQTSIFNNINLYNKSKKFIQDCIDKKIQT